MGNIEKVRPIAEKVYEEVKADGLTLKEFQMLIGLLGTKAHEIQKERNNRILAEKL